LLGDKPRLKSLSENIQKLGRPNAAKDIVDVILEVVESRKSEVRSQKSEDRRPK
jgi:hypothetical protein